MKDKITGRFKKLRMFAIHLKNKNASERYVTFSVLKEPEYMKYWRFRKFGTEYEIPVWLLMEFNNCFVKHFGQNYFTRSNRIFSDAFNSYLPAFLDMKITEFIYCFALKQNSSPEDYANVIENFVEKKEILLDHKMKIYHRKVLFEKTKRKYNYNKRNV